MYAVLYEQFLFMFYHFISMGVLLKLICQVYKLLFSDKI